MNTQRIGFIGQGFIGKHMADDFKNRGFDVVRYALEEPYVRNKALIAECDIVFIAVPTPTTPEGFDASIIEGALGLIGVGKTVVIKSTVLPGTTARLQAVYPDIYVLHSPEFLREKTAAEDTARPERNIVGVPKDKLEFWERAEAVMSVLPYSPHNLTMLSNEAECIKYIGNTFLYTKLVFMNIAHDFAEAAGADWEVIRQAVGFDSRIGSGHTSVVFDSGRGAGGHCFIKDFEALVEYYAANAEDATGLRMLKALRAKNNQLLLDSGKDLGLLHGVYGDHIPV